MRSRCPASRTAHVAPDAWFRSLPCRCPGYGTHGSKRAKGCRFSCEPSGLTGLLHQLSASHLNLIIDASALEYTRIHAGGKRNNLAVIGTSSYRPPAESPSLLPALRELRAPTRTGCRNEYVKLCSILSL